MKSIYFTTIFFLIVLNLFSQITLTEIEKKTEAPINNQNSYAKYIGERIFLPPLRNPKESEFGPYNTIIAYKVNPTKIKTRLILDYVYYPFNFIKCGDCDISENYWSNGDSISNRYYKILNVDKGILFSGRNSVHDQNDKEENFFLLKNEEKGDSIYVDVSYVLTYFISILHFDSLKNLYDGQNLIYIYGNTFTRYNIQKAGKEEVQLSPGSKWKCQIGVFKISGLFNLCYILENEKKEKVAIEESGFANYRKRCLINSTKCSYDETNSNDGYKNCAEYNEDGHGFIEFFTENEFLKRKKLLAQNKQVKDLETKKVTELRNLKNANVTYQHLQYCINSFGEKNGKAIANGIVKIGMSKEMCRVAWGNPIDIHKTTTENDVIETWNYGFMRSLLFVNGTLQKIEE